MRVKAKSTAIAKVAVIGFGNRGRARAETRMRLFGLPLSSLFVLILIPLGIIAYQYFVCWEIKTGRRD